MTVKKITDVSLRLMFALTWVASATGCIKEDLSDCNNASHTFTVRAYDSSGGELSQSDVQDVALYIFNSSLCFVECIDAQIGQNVQVQIPGGEDIHIVAWGNLKGGSQKCTTPSVGDHKDVCFINLLPHTRSLNYSISPDDLFRGEITVSKEKQSGEKVLPIYRETGNMTIIVRNLKTFTGFNDDNYAVEVRETHSIIDFYGNLSGDKVAYRPAGSFLTTNNREEYDVPPFNLMPEDTGIYIDIYHNGGLVTTVSQDGNGNPITVQKGKLTNVLIDLKATLNVSVSLTAWGEREMWKEF